MINVSTDQKVSLGSTFATSQVIESSSLQKKSHPHITFLFNETILKLTHQQESIMRESPGEYVTMAEKIIQESCFYSLLKGVKLQQVPLTMDTLLLTILELNEHCIHTPDDEGIITSAILACFRLLVKEEGWSSMDSTNFFEQLYHLHILNYGNNDMTPVLALIDGGTSAGYLSPKSQKFMDKVTYEEQFEPITKYLLRENEVITEKKTQIFIAQIADKFFTQAVKTSYKVMSNNIYDFPIIEHVTALVGMNQFRQITIHTKYIYMRALRQLHLSCIANSKRNPSTTKNSMKVIEKKVTISKQTYTVSFAVISEQKKMTIKAITLSCDLDFSQDTSETTYQDVYFFVQELRKETPWVHPDHAIPLSERSLYKFELIPNCHSVRIQEASEEVRKEIINLIGEIQGEIIEETKNEVTIECALHTAIWHHEELMLVEIIRQIGSMLSSRALYGAIKTYVKNLPEPSEDKLPKKYIDFQDFKEKLQQILISAYVLVTNEYLSSWYQDDLLKPLVTQSYNSIQETASMKIIKEHTWEVFNKHKHPGKWLFKSIMSCCYDGNPTSLVPLNATHVNKSNKQTLHFEECKTLLNTALKTQQEQVVLSLVKAMVKGIVAIMKSSKGKNMIADLIKYFESVEEFPLEIIPNIMKTRETSQQKASHLFYTLFSLKSLDIEATEEQYKTIKTFLKLKG